MKSFPYPTSGTELDTRPHIFVIYRRLPFVPGPTTAPAVWDRLQILEKSDLQMQHGPPLWTSTRPVQRTNGRPTARGSTTQLVHAIRAPAGDGFETSRRLHKPLRPMPTRQPIVYSRSLRLALTATLDHERLVTVCAFFREEKKME